MSKVFVGIDVSARELAVARQDEPRLRRFANDRQGHKALIKHLAKKGRTARVCLEATGVYSLDVAVALSKAKGIEVMMANPRAIKDFAGAIMRRSKDDQIDAVILAEYAARMPFVSYVPHSAQALKLRAISRRIAALTSEMVAEKNRLHAASATEIWGTAVDIKVHIRFLKKRIEVLRTRALNQIRADEELSWKYDCLVSVKGIAKASAIQILGELVGLPEDMDKRQWTAHAGLDPKHYTSGSSVNKKSRISKRGNCYIRRALYMPAVVAARREPSIKEYYLHLLDAGKKPLQALVAVMRKLLCAIWGMFSTRQPFDGSRFYQAAAIAA